jgi:hypothetical protein
MSRGESNYMQRHENQKLIQCRLTTASGMQQKRFIEFELFKLWQYMMQTKHAFEISDLAMCLWVSEKDYLIKKSLYDRSGDILNVDRLTVSIFDQRNGFSHITNRFARKEDTDQVKSILLSHVPKELADSADFSLDITPGRTIERGPISGLSEISLGLSND